MVASRHSVDAETADSEDLNVRILRSIVLYLRDTRGDGAVADLVAPFGPAGDRIARGSGWVSHEVFEAFIHRARSELGSVQEFVEACGRDIRRGYGALLVAFSFLSAAQAFETIARTMFVVSRISRYTITRRTSRDLTLKYYSQRAESRLMCLTRRAQLPMVSTFVGLPRANLEEVSCIAWGDPCCTYRLRVPARARWRTLLIGTTVGVVSAILTPATVISGGLSLWLFPLLGLAVGGAIELRRRFVAQRRFLDETQAELHADPTLSLESAQRPGSTSANSPLAPIDRDAPTQTSSPLGSRTDAPTEQAQLHSGRRLDRYELLEPAGRGGMGTVFSARDTKLGRRVALKFLHARETAEDAVAARLVREAQALAALAHPNVVTVFDVGEAEDKVFLTMEYVEGGTLKTWPAEHPDATLTEKMGVLLQAAEGLAAAHDAGLIHRDFKPSNVLVGEDGRVRVADFGLARRAATADSDPRSPRPEADDRLPRVSLTSPVTTTGVVAGTPRYMAPEQHENRRLDPRCDQFAFCVVAYELLAGVHPFAPNTTRTSDALPGPTPAAPVHFVPETVLAVLARGFSTSRTRRYRSMGELLEKLRDAHTQALQGDSRGSSLLARLRGR